MAWVAVGLALGLTLLTGTVTWNVGLGPSRFDRPSFAADDRFVLNLVEDALGLP